MIFNILSNNLYLIQKPIVFFLGKISYDIIYYNKHPSSKIITYIMCYFGSQYIWNLCFDFIINEQIFSTNKEQQMCEKNESESIYENMIIDPKMQEFTNRADITGITNEADRLVQNIEDLLNK